MIQSRRTHTESTGSSLGTGSRITQIPGISLDLGRAGGEFQVATAAELRQAASTFLQERFAAPAGLEDRRFTAFDPEQVSEAARLARRFGEIAAERGDRDGVGDVLEAARVAVREQLPGLVKYALQLFLTHDPIGAQVGTPSLEERHPNAVRSMIESQVIRTEDNPASLSFFREDVFANDHHAHWHQVYMASDLRRQERQGEMFVYMHQQMLARYDAERLALDVGEVKALGLEAPASIEEGYDPRNDSYASRPDNARLPDDEADGLEGRRKAFYEGIRDRAFEDVYERNAFDPSFRFTYEPVLNLLGAVLEAEFGERAPHAFDFPGINLHNSGHGTIGRPGLVDPDDDRPGVMWDPSVAIKDPVFWRWHKVIDDVGAAWQHAQPERDFQAPEDRGPGVVLRSGADGSSADLILWRNDETSVVPFGDLEAGAAFGEEAFGGARWDDDFADTSPGTPELLTHMATRPWEGEEIAYADMVDEFAYFLRVENTRDEPTDVTVRLFIVPEQWSSDRRRWIEMDKAIHTVEPGRQVIYRPSSLSSVIRKPATRPPAPAPPSNEPDGENYCSCGWPYNLLLPRANETGMTFRLMAILTDAAWDRAQESGCGSMSFCGLRDAYPDRRAMGYPFDRKLKGDTVETLNGLDHAATRLFTIRRIA